MLYTYDQINTLGTSRLGELESAADNARTIRETTAPVTLGDRLGDLLLRWGRGLRERSGTVSVQIELEPATHHSNAA